MQRSFYNIVLRVSIYVPNQIRMDILDCRDRGICYGYASVEDGDDDVLGRGEHGDVPCRLHEVFWKCH